MMEQGPSARNNTYRLFVGNMGSRMTESELHAMVCQFGTVQEHPGGEGHLYGSLQRLCLCRHDRSREGSAGSFGIERKTD